MTNLKQVVRIVRVVLIEIFAGIGAQRKALQILGVKIDNEKSKICEWAYNSFISYNAIHHKDFTDYSANMTKEELIEKCVGVSTNYNEPLSSDQLKRKPIEWLKSAYNSIVATHNLVNIMNVKGQDLELDKVKDQTIILCYRFPCQDLSLAGQRKGMSVSQKEGGTRSGLLWEVERILTEMYNTHTHTQHSTLPHILLMENVPEVVGKNNIDDFKKWEEKLRSFGYKNYVEILNGKDYGIPQNRRRTFMISILGDYSYEFPRKLPLKYVLKDFLEDNVEEKYFLDDKTLERISNWKAQQNPLDNMVDTTRERERVISTLTARGAGEEHSGMKLIGIPSIPIKENNSKGYKNAKIGDGVNLASRMAHQRGNVQRESIQTLKTEMEVGVVVDDKIHK